MAHDLATLDARTNAHARMCCPGCASLLATPLALQCFTCGLDWHAGVERNQIASLAIANSHDAALLSRRSWLRQFSRLFVAGLAAQIAALCLFVLLFREPAAFLLALVIGVPIYMWLDLRMGRLAVSSRLASSAGKLCVLAVGIVAVALPDRFLLIAIGVFLCLGLSGILLYRSAWRIPIAVTRMLLLVAAGLGTCHALGIGSTVTGCFLATLALVEFGSVMVALDAWEKRSRLLGR